MATEPASDTKTDVPDEYSSLLDRVKRWNTVGSAAGVLGWDQQVMMPEGGTPARSKQLSTLSSIRHDMITDDETGTLLDALADTDLTPEQRAVVREIRREYERADAVPVELVEQISETGSEALQAWEKAKAEDDFETFAPYLKKHVELKREYAAHIDPDRDPYEVLFEEYEPCLSMERAEAILDELRETLVPMIEAIRASDRDLAVDTFEGTFPEQKQERLARDALELVGYDFDRGRLDVSSHPFTAGNQFDCRVTTRFDESDPLGAIGSTIHEYGHAQYNLGLPQDHWGTPLGESRDLSVHESQSRLWENHVGRSRAFWEQFLPLFQDYFPETADASVSDAYEAFNQVHEDNLIRVEADELTYHLHIIVRFEIERDLVRGDLAVEDVPAVWNDKYDEYLGIRPDSDSEGCLQDIHWSHGNFGYFPTYSLGSVMAAQLYAAAAESIDDLEAQIAAGEFASLQRWLGENGHQHGSRYETNELVKQATGDDFSADAFTTYISEKYGDLYGI